MGTFSGLLWRHRTAAHRKRDGKARAAAGWTRGAHGGRRCAFRNTDGQPELRVEQMETRGSESRRLERLDSGVWSVVHSGWFNASQNSSYSRPSSKFCWAKETRLWLSTCRPLPGPSREPHGDRGPLEAKEQSDVSSLGRFAPRVRFSIDLPFKEPSCFSSGALLARSAEGQRRRGPGKARPTAFTSSLEAAITSAPATARRSHLVQDSTIVTSPRPVLKP
jgi:hypothetical protein